MSPLEYLLKFSLSLAVLYIFYRTVLRPLTFYKWNRFFLLGYSLMSLVLPFMNITPLIGEDSKEKNQILTRIPLINVYTSAESGINWTNWMLAIFCTGAVIMFARVLMQYFSLLRIKKQSRLLYSSQDMRLYDTVKKINPFSFAKDIYINTGLHSEEELQRIIQHEIVHVRQQHFVDIMIGELLCVLNWFNPFAWLIRSAIRQNLEFIADNNMIEKGHDKKEYQYLLLKVIGISQYSITNNFSLPNLKKRIAMMNKMKSAKIHLAKFLFALPLAVIVLLGFRKEKINKTQTATPVIINTIANDTVPPNTKISSDESLLIGVKSELLPNQKGYIVTVANDNDECIVLIRNRSKKIIKALPLTEWDSNRSGNEKMYGKILPPPPPHPAPVPPVHAMNNPAPRVSNAARPAPAVPSVPAAPDVAPIVPPVPAAPEAPSVSMIIRNTDHSKNPDSQPIYILNNKEVSADIIMQCDTMLIESMNVTKGDEAIKAYGSRGKNGIIEIKTKAVLNN